MHTDVGELVAEVRCGVTAGSLSSHMVGDAKASDKNEPSGLCSSLLGQLVDLDAQAFFFAFYSSYIFLSRSGKFVVV